MKRYSQLARLILDFYRENEPEFEQLKLLGRCKVARRWGVLRIHCSNHEVAQAVLDVCTLVSVPVAQLRLAKKIKVFVNNGLVAVFPVQGKRRQPQVRVQ